MKKNGSKFGEIVKSLLVIFVFTVAARSYLGCANAGEEQVLTAAPVATTEESSEKDIYAQIADVVAARKALTSSVKEEQARLLAVHKEVEASIDGMVQKDKIYIEIAVKRQGSMLQQNRLTWRTDPELVDENKIALAKYRQVLESEHNYRFGRLYATNKNAYAAGERVFLARYSEEDKKLYDQLVALNGSWSKKYADAKKWSAEKKDNVVAWFSSDDPKETAVAQAKK